MTMNPQTHPPCLACDANRRRLARNKRQREARKVRDGILRDCGLTKVKGGRGGTYWE